MKTLICPECKNEVNLSVYPSIVAGQMIECDSCGISLEVTEAGGEKLEVEIADEGK